MKILVFGGAGFIGHHLVNHLQHNYDVCVYDNFSIFGVKHEQQIQNIIQNRIKKWYNVDTVNGSILDSSLVKDTFDNFQPEIVVNLASYPRVNFVDKYPTVSARSMIEGMINTFHYDIQKYIHISSSNVYGNYQDNANESTFCSPINLYGSLKLTQEHLLKAESKKTNLNYIILRPICVFGNNDLSDRLISKFIKSAVNNQDLFYAQDTITDITYVEDIVNAIELSITSKIENETFNISSEHRLTIKQISEIIKEHFNSTSNIIPVNREKYFPNHGALLIDKAKNTLGYERKFDFFEALKKIDPNTIF